MNTNNILIVICTPPIAENSGGIMALHNLAKKINELNYKFISAKLFCLNNKQYNNDYCNDFFDPSKINPDNTIVIYPEIIRGNPLNAKHVIRWILMELQKNINPIIDLKWKKDDIVYHWIKFKGENFTNKNIKQLYIPFINKSFKKYNNNKRINTCYLIKKGHILHSNSFLQIHPNDSINIDNFSLEEINETFNNCHTFYCYDPYTFFAFLAPLCGCLTVLYPLKNISKYEYFINLPHYDELLCNSGIAYGYIKEELEFAENTLNEAEINLKKIISKNEIYVNMFLDDIYNYIAYNKILIKIKDLY